MLVGLSAAGVLVGSHAAIGVVKDAPEDAHADNLGGARSALRFGLGLRLGLLRLSRFLLGSFVDLVLLAFVFAFLAFVFAFLLFILLAFLLIFLFLVFLLVFSFLILAAFGGVEIRPQSLAIHDAPTHD
jgi:hypothetical protein